MCDILYEIVSLPTHNSSFCARQHSQPRAKYSLQHHLWSVYIQSVSKKLGETSGLDLLHQILKKKIHANLCPQTLCSRGAGQQSVDFSPLEFWLWEHLKTTVFSVLNESGHFTDEFLIRVKPLTTDPELLKWCDTICALKNVTGVLSVCFEM